VTSGVDEGIFQGLGRAMAVHYLTAHQMVLETVMHDYPVLPVKFGTMLPDEEMLRILLHQGGRMLRTTLESYAGTQQYEVVVLWDLQKIFPQIAAEEPIAALRTKLAGRAPDEAVDERVILGQMVHAALQRRRGQIGAQVIARLRDLADDMIMNPMMDDSMVVNVALLLKVAHQGELDERLGVLDALFGGQLQIRCVGPLPSYSFATLEAQAFSFDAVDIARQQLGLAEEATTAAIKRAYRQLATQAHPDHNPSAEHAVAQMEALTGAYQLLSTLVRAQSPTVGDEDGDWLCRLDRRSVERTLLLAVVRQEGTNE
jgi:hypothetical protein